jgi:hypothetical protein
MAKTASALICSLALLPATATAAEPLPSAQGLVTSPTAAVEATVSQTTATVEAAPKRVTSAAESATSTVRTTVETATTRLRGTVTAVEDAAPVAQAATPVVRTVAAPTSGATQPTEVRWPAGANAVGRAAGAISGRADQVGLASVDGGETAARRDVTSPLLLAGLPTPEARPLAAASSTPARSGGDGPDTPGGPGGGTGGISGPLGFVLIAAVLAGIFLMAPRFIGRPLHMTSWRPRSAALALPIEWPD